jgi:hypothetical protein
MGGGLLTPIMGQVFQRTSIIIMPFFLLVTSLLLTVTILLYIKNKDTKTNKKKEGRHNA